MLKIPGRIAIVAAVLVAACTTLPEGPNVTALPGTGKSFDQFRADDADCRQFAMEQIGGKSPNQVASDRGVESAVVGTVVGAAAGAALGGGRGAGIGAGTGLLVGSAAGAGAAESSGYGMQRRYDNAYVQCMYAKGERVPVAGRMRDQGTASRAASLPPPPPPGMPPPPPPPPGMSSPPVPGPATMVMPPPAVGTRDGLFVYPRNGQGDSRIAQDRAECSRWATDQTGYDPAVSSTGDARRPDYQRAAGACLDAHGYTVK
jgi:outer membrane lipoprotein SlyB